MVIRLTKAQKAFTVVLCSLIPGALWALVVAGWGDQDLAPVVLLALFFSAAPVLVALLSWRLGVEADEAGITVRNGVWAEHHFAWDEVEDFRTGPGSKGHPVVYLVPRRGGLVRLAVTQGRSQRRLESYVTDLRGWLPRR